MDKRNASEAGACQEGQKEAQQDIENGELGYYFYGLPTPRFNTFVRAVSEELKLKIKGGGDIIDESGECYNEVIKTEIERIYGNDAFKMISLMVDSLETLDLIDKDAHFPGGDEKLKQYIYCNLEAELFKEDDAPEIAVSCEISKTGTIENFRIRRLKNLEQDSAQYISGIRSIFEKMPAWIPGQTEQKPVRYNWTMNIKFSDEMRNRNCD
ncbi:MAG: hypothetical protein IPL46_14575 [Saprospiraceae bacterium]|nr:hypothetical protein [Saprospiraceae bacterium]